MHSLNPCMRNPIQVAIRFNQHCSNIKKKQKHKIYFAFLRVTVNTKVALGGTAGNDPLVPYLELYINMKKKTKR